uniref:Uncharacterized protein n=1 Tax=Tanacetum cinerariifolium TaxID=118510 RepID=A0A699QRV3_TANCI|nr:hypothetical protein [Tanacetum cinerariifolium]
MTLEEAKAQMEKIKRLEFLKSEKRLKVLTPEELEAHAAELAAYKAKRANMLQEYNHCITFRADPLHITKITYRVNNSTKEASMRITRDNQLVNLTVYDKFILKMLGFTERKVSMKRKRRSELIHETFVKENIVVNGMQRNLTLLEGVVGKAGMMIKEPKARIFLYDGNFDLVFQRRSEYALA